MTGFDGVNISGATLDQIYYCEINSYEIEDLPSYATAASCFRCSSVQSAALTSKKFCKLVMCFSCTHSFCNCSNSFSKADTQRAAYVSGKSIMSSVTFSWTGCKIC